MVLSLRELVFKFHRGSVAQGAVEPFGIVKRFDVIEDAEPAQLALFGRFVHQRLGFGQRGTVAPRGDPAPQGPARHAQIVGDRVLFELGVVTPGVFTIVGHGFLSTPGSPLRKIEETSSGLHVKRQTGEAASDPPRSGAAVEPAFGLAFLRPAGRLRCV